MLYSEEANLVFIHVPKNAGKSMRNAFARSMDLSHAFLARDLAVGEARARQLMDEEIDVPGLGLVKPAHLPLAIIASRFPATWTTIRAVAAGQVADWPAFWLRNYKAYAGALDHLTAAIDAADENVGD